MHGPGWIYRGPRQGCPCLHCASRRRQLDRGRIRRIATLFPHLTFLTLLLADEPNDAPPAGPLDVVGIPRDGTEAYFRS